MFPPDGFPIESESRLLCLTTEMSLLALSVPITLSRVAVDPGALLEPLDLSQKLVRGGQIADVADKVFLRSYQLEALSETKSGEEERNETGTQE